MLAWFSLIVFTISHKSSKLFTMILTMGSCDGAKSANKSSTWTAAPRCEESPPIAFTIHATCLAADRCFCALHSAAERGCFANTAVSLGSTQGYLNLRALWLCLSLRLQWQPGNPRFLQLGRCSSCASWRLTTPLWDNQGICSCVQAGLKRDRRWKPGYNSCG